MKVLQEEDRIRVWVPEKMRQPRVTVVVLEMADQLARVVDETLHQEKNGVIKLPVARCEFATRRTSYDYETQLTYRWGESTKQGLIWTVNVTQPGSFKVISEDTGNEDYVYELITENGTLELDAKGDAEAVMNFEADPQGMELDDLPDQYPEEVERFSWILLEFKASIPQGVPTEASGSKQYPMPKGN